MPRPRSGKSKAEQREEKRDRDQIRQRGISSDGRDILKRVDGEYAPFPEIANPRRRGRCRKSLRLFCETYNPEAFTLDWSADHLRAIERIEEAVFHGALYAFAEPRGNGKSTRVRMAALWALSYAHCRYVYIIGANDTKAADTLAALKMFIRFLPDYAADFPEIAFPAGALAGIANRASGQTCGGEPTMIEWGADRIVLPTVKPPPNWPKAWPLRDDGYVPTSGAVAGVSGLTGEGIRGSLKTLTTGEQVRPDLVLIDDPQTRESAFSKTQNETRLQLVSADVLGMAGPGKSISAVMPCTVIAPGDFIDKILDRAEHPLWRGERTRMLRSMPKNLEAWDGYFEVYRRCVLKEPPEFAESNAYYLTHREILEAGAEASWEARKLDWEVSAVQHAMHLYYRDRRAFFAEYQNSPLSPDLGQIADLDPAAVAKKVNGLGRAVVPGDCSLLTAGVDVQGEILFYAVCGWRPDFSGSVVDYGTVPRQNRSYFDAGDARPSLSSTFPGYDESARIFAGLKALFGEVVGRQYARDGGGDKPIDRCLVDTGKWDTAVREACRASPLASLLTPAKGYGIRAGGSPMANWARREGETPGDHWVERPTTGGGRGRLLLIDTNYWKSFVASRLLTPEMGAGCLRLFGDQRADHRLFADHLTAEYRVETAGLGRRLEEWKAKPGRLENHWWDCLVYATVAASRAGLVWSPAAAAGDPPPPPPVRKRVKLSELYAKKHGVT